MSTTVVVIHSAGPQADGQGSSRLVAHLRRALTGAQAVRSPALPSPERPTYRAWRAAIDDVLSETDGPLLLVGHSLGGSVLLKYLTDAPSPRPIRGLFLVAAPYWGDTDWESDDFELRAGYADAIPADLPVYLYHSRDDDVVPAAHAERYRAEIPRAILRLVEGRGHEFGDGLPELIEDLATHAG